MSHGQHERSQTPAAALDQLQGHCRKHNLEIELTSVGRQLKTWTCSVTDRKAKTAIGRGKGWEKQANASALAEALEHYWYTSEDTTKFAQPVLLDFSQENAFSRASPDFRLIFGAKQVSLDCLNFEPFMAGSESLLFPAVLLDAAYRQSPSAGLQTVNFCKLHRYGTNSGTSAGLSPTEAWLHGLLEVIERDAVGIALLRSVVAKQPTPVRKVRIASLTGSLGQLPDLLDSETGGCHLELWDITTELNVATILSAISVDRPSGCYRYFGSGTSLSSVYATERSILEALQGFHIHQLLGGFAQDPFRPGTTSNTSLYRSCELDSGHFDYRGGETEIDIDDVPTHEAAGIDSQLTFLTERLNAIECSAYRRIIFECDLFTVGQVVVPNLERFYLVAHGIPVAPSWRGRRFLEALR
jgi:ribosomal protein S12 methylthiotransferase accessory factor